MFAVMPSTILSKSTTKFTAAYRNKRNVSGVTGQKAFKIVWHFRLNEPLYGYLQMSFSSGVFHNIVGFSTKLSHKTNCFLVTLLASASVTPT